MKFNIPPEYCLIINAFNQADSLRGAAVLLNTDPPALVRKVQKIATDFGYLQKIGNRWVLTEAGRRIAQWTDEMISSQAELSKEKSVLRISSFSWLAEEMLIPNFQQLQKLLKPDQVCAFKMIATNQEQELLQSRTDLVIQGHAPTDPAIAYKRVSSHNWVVVAPYAWRKKFARLNVTDTISTLHRQRFIRHTQLNPETILGFQPTTKSYVTTDGVIGLRSAVHHGEGWTALPTMAAARYIKEGKLVKLNVPTFLKDDVSVWWVRARKDMTETAKHTDQWIKNWPLSLQLRA